MDKERKRELEIDWELGEQTIYCGCGNELLTEHEQETGFCNDCI